MGTLNCVPILWSEADLFRPTIEMVRDPTIFFGWHNVLSREIRRPRVRSIDVAGFGVNSPNFCDDIHVIIHRKNDHSRSIFPLCMGNGSGIVFTIVVNKDGRPNESNPQNKVQHDRKVLFLNGGGNWGV